MEHLPIILPVGFIFTTLLTSFLFYRSGKSKPAILVLLGWLLLQAGITLSGFYQILSGFPPRFALLVLPPVICIAILFATNNGRRFISSLDIKALTLLHIVRLPVELTLYGLFLHQAVPIQMTFEGGNYDILCGLTAPLIWYFGFKRPVINRIWLLAWNVLCLLSLLHIVGTALSFVFTHVSIALVYFPYSWLPCLVVPVVLLAHLSAIRKLVLNK